MRPHSIKFESQVYTTIYPEWKESNPVFKQRILEIKDKNPETTDTVKENTGWHSSYFLHTEYDHFLKIQRFVEGACIFISKKYFGNPLPFDIYNLWAMTYDIGQDTKPHHHFPSCFSAVYFVDVEKNAAPLCFPEGSFIPQNGLLIVFPGSLIHWVPPTDGSRVILSMNLDGDSKEKFKMIRKT